MDLRSKEQENKSKTNQKVIGKLEGDLIAVESVLKEIRSQNRFSNRHDSLLESANAHKVT